MYLASFSFLGPSAGDYMSGEDSLKIFFLMIYVMYVCVCVCVCVCVRACVRGYLFEIEKLSSHFLFSYLISLEMIERFGFATSKYSANKRISFHFDSVYFILFSFC